MFNISANYEENKTNTGQPCSLRPEYCGFIGSTLCAPASSLRQPPRALIQALVPTLPSHCPHEGHWRCLLIQYQASSHLSAADHTLGSAFSVLSPLLLGHQILLASYCVPGSLC